MFFTYSAYLYCKHDMEKFDYAIDKNLLRAFSTAQGLEN